MSDLNLDDQIIKRCSNVYNKLNSLASYFLESDSDRDLLVQLMHKASEIVKQQNAKPLFLFLPAKSSVKPSGKDRYLPNLYAKRLEFLQQKSLEIIDVRQAFLKYEENLDDLYFDDNSHFLSPGNKIIAEQIKSYLLSRY